MSGNRNRRAGKGRSGGSGGKSGRNRSGGKKGSRKPPASDDRRFWSHDAAEARVRALTGEVRPAPDPTAVVRSLGPPPLGRFGDNAQHYYAAVYEKAQRFAVAMAAANGVLVVDGDAEPEDDLAAAAVAQVDDGGPVS